MGKHPNPLLIDSMAFVRAATETPKPVVIGARAGEIDAPPAQEQAVPQVVTKEKKPKAEPVTKKEPEARDPWEGADPKFIHYFQIRMPKPLNLKLQWLVDNSVGRHSMHSIALEAVESVVDARIAEIKKRAGKGHA